MTTEQVDTILLKDGKDWTPEDRVVINQYVRDNSRSKLKARRKELLNPVDTTE